MGKYIFKLSSDGESRFWFNGKLYIEKIYRDLRWRDEAGLLISDGLSLFREEMISRVIFMNAMQFYKIKIEYRHFSGWNYRNPTRAFLSLLWALEVVKKDHAAGISVKYDRFGPGRLISGGSSSLTIVERNSYGIIDAGGGDFKMNSDWLKILYDFNGTGGGGGISGITDPYAQILEYLRRMGFDFASGNFSSIVIMEFLRRQNININW
jgi:PA14 domain